MKKVIFALALVATFMVSCNKNGATSTETTIDSTEVAVDTVAVDSTATQIKVDTTTAGPVK